MAFDCSTLLICAAEACRAARDAELTGEALAAGHELASNAAREELAASQQLRDVAGQFEQLAREYERRVAMRSAAAPGVGA